MAGNGEVQESEGPGPERGAQSVTPHKAPLGSKNRFPHEFHGCLCMSSIEKRVTHKVVQRAI